MILALFVDLLFGFESLRFVPLGFLVGSITTHVDTANVMLGKTQPLVRCTLYLPDF